MLTWQVLCPLLETKPWIHDTADGSQRRFLQGHWTKIPTHETRRLHKAEAQCWLAVYNLVLTPAVRRRCSSRPLFMVLVVVIGRTQPRTAPT